MNPKISKIETELEKARKKISELQDHAFRHIQLLFNEY